MKLSLFTRVLIVSLMAVGVAGQGSQSHETQIGTPRPISEPFPTTLNDEIRKQQAQIAEQENAMKEFEKALAGAKFYDKSVGVVFMSSGLLILPAMVTALLFKKPEIRSFFKEAALYSTLLSGVSGSMGFTLTYPEVARLTTELEKAKAVIAEKREFLRSLSKLSHEGRN
jgi:hypothetical protein